MYVIAGLGNPGSRYDKTRHNAGFDTIDLIGKRYGIPVKEQKFKALIGSGFIEGQKVLLVKPQTFMNLSGESLAPILQYFHVDPETELIVVFDDISLEPGHIRIRKKGSAGGHNGMKSIISCIGTQQFMRVKVGVGEKPEGWDLADYVTGRFDRDDRQLVEEAFDHAADAVKLMIQDETDQAMNRYNVKG